MEDKNKLAKDWYKRTYWELQEIINIHCQITMVNPFHNSLPILAAKIERLAACLEVWRNIAKHNATRKFLGG